jgi:phospholipase C
VDITRRDLIASTAAALGAAALAHPETASAANPSALPAPAQSNIDHVVVVMMENRSFDHYLGWLPGANGRQGGLGIGSK